MALVDDDIRAVPSHVLPQKLDGVGVRVDRVDRLRLSSAGDEDRIRTDAREHVHDDLTRSHLLGNPPSFGPEARREVRPLNVDQVSKAELDVLRAGLPFSCNDPDLPDAEFPLDALVHGHRPDLRIPPHDRLANGPFKLPQFLGEADHDNVSDCVEGLWKEGFEAGRDLHQIAEVTDDGEARLELSFENPVREAGRRSHRDVQDVSCARNTEFLPEDTGGLEPAADLLPHSDWDLQAQGLHTAPMSPSLFLDFRTRGEARPTFIRG